MSINTKQALGKDFVKLTGFYSHYEWARLFKKVAARQGLLEYYDGTADQHYKPVKPTPLRTSKIERKGSTPPSKDCDSPKSSLPSSDDFDSVSYSEYKVKLKIYEIELRLYEKYREKALAALYLLEDAVEDYVWDKLDDEQKEEPCAAWAHLSEIYRTPNHLIVQRAEAKMDALTVTDPTAIRTLLSEFGRCYKDINAANGFLTYTVLIYKVNKALPCQYRLFIDDWKMSHLKKEVATQETWEQYQDLVTEYAEDHKEAWNAAK